MMGQQYQDTISSFAASPQAMDQQQATQTAGNNTLGKSMEQSPVHDGFGTRSSMYDNGMDVSAQPAPVAMPPKPQNQPSSAGVNPSWAQQPRKRGGRAKRADGGPLAAFGSMADQPYSMMRTGDTIKAFGQAQPMAAAAPAMPAAAAQTPAAMGPSQRLPINDPQVDAFPYATDGKYRSDYQSPVPNIYGQNLSNEGFLNSVYGANLGRQADDPGKAFWLNQLTSGGMSQKDVENFILNSPEANANFVNQLYQSDLGRAPDTEGQKYWANMLNAGKASRQDVENFILNSPEGSKYMRGQGVLPDVGERVDPFVAEYNARMANAQKLYGGIAQQNFAQNTADQGEYEKQLAQVQAANQERLAAAQKAKADRQAREAEAARQQQLMMMLMMMRK